MLLKVSFRTMVFSDLDFEYQLADVQRQSAKFKDYASPTLGWYAQKECALSASMVQYRLYSLFFRQSASARGSVQSQIEFPAQRTGLILSESKTSMETGNLAGTPDEPAVVGGGDATAEPAVADPAL